MTYPNLNSARFIVAACLFPLLLSACAGPSNPPAAPASAAITIPAAAPKGVAVAEIVTGLPGGSSLASTVIDVAQGAGTAPGGNVAAPGNFSATPMAFNLPENSASAAVTGSAGQDMNLLPR